MANTGFIINETVRQFFASGPNSGSAVTASTDFDVDLTVAPFSASLDNETFYNRAFEPDDCPEGFETCVPPLLVSLTTGSQRGRFAINYVTQSSFNPPTRITASVSNDISFSIEETFSASIGSIIPVTTSFVSGTVYFEAFTSCSGPDPSPDSTALSFTYDLIPPQLAPGTVNLVFKNNYSSAMKVEIRSLRGNANYTISPRQSITYDYTTSPDPGAWTATGKSEDLSITIKGGARSPYGNYIQRKTEGIEKETYTTEGGFSSPTSATNNSSTFAADRGLSFKVRQLVLPVGGTTTTTTFTLLEKDPPPPPIPPSPPPPPSPGPPGPAPASVSRPTSRFGSTPYSSEAAACGNANADFRSIHYYQYGNVFYNNLTDAQSRTRSSFPYSSNYILYGNGTYYIVNKDGRITNTGGCRRPSITLYTLRGSYGSQEEACRQNKTGAGNTTYTIGSIRVSGRYPLAGSGKGGRNAIISGGNVVAYETCGSELTPVQYGSIGWPNSRYPLGSPSNVNPRSLQLVCSNTSLQTYYQGPSGVVYYGTNYVPLGLGTRWYRTTSGTFVNFDRGLIIDSTSPC
jgi:hypothetical protein